MFQPSFIGTTLPSGAQSNVADHVDQARAAIASLKQTGTVAAYKSAFNILVSRLGTDSSFAGQQVFWWNQGLKPRLPKQLGSCRSVAMAPKLWLTFRVHGSPYPQHVHCACRCSTCCCCCRVFKDANLSCCPWPFQLGCQCKQLQGQGQVQAVSATNSTDPPCGGHWLQQGVSLCR